MELDGIHLLMTYRCTHNCDHCFVWGSPEQRGTMKLSVIRRILEQSRELGTVKSVYFEGGEPFEFYAVLLSGVRLAAKMGFEVGVVSNAYWATDPHDATEYLGPLEGLITDFTVSADWYHWTPGLRRNVESACKAARNLGIPFRVACVSSPESIGVDCDLEHMNIEQIPVMYRGRAAERLGPEVTRLPWLSLTSCDCEDLRAPGRVHVDPFGHVHVCQGITIGNIFDRSLREIGATYAPDSHPVVGPLLQGGPVELALRHGLNHEGTYADTCHACYDLRLALRRRFPDILAPDQMYGVKDELDPFESLNSH